MPEYIVKVKWETFGEMKIEAKDAAEAEAKAYANGIPRADQETGIGKMTVLDAVPANDPMETGEL
jgi:hypothetical protein